MVSKTFDGNPGSIIELEILDRCGVEAIAYPFRISVTARVDGTRVRVNEGMHTRQRHRWR